MKRLIFELEDELHKKMKLEAYKNDMTIKSYVTDLIKKDLQQKGE